MTTGNVLIVSERVFKEDQRQKTVDMTTTWVQLNKLLKEKRQNFLSCSYLTYLSIEFEIILTLKSAFHNKSVYFI